MWPKRKKGKARATKVKLKALQPADGQSEDEDQKPDTPAEVSQPAGPDDPISGVWKSRVLNNYKQNPRDSHNLLARIPTGKAAFEAGERQKHELTYQSMIKIVDRMFDNFQNTAYEFNQVTGGSDLELTWIRPHFMQEDIASWHDATKVPMEIFTGRISTRYWTLAVRGTVAGIGAYILPSDKLLGFTTSPSSYPCYLSMIPQSDGMEVSWLINKQAIDPDLFPSVYRALLDGLIRFASEEAQHGESFRLEDIGIVPEAPPPPEETHGYHRGEQYELLGQSSARNLVAEPRISEAAPAASSADRFIDNISNQVAQAAQSETDRFRESMHAPPFGTAQPRPAQEVQHSGVTSAQTASSYDDGADGEWKTISSGQTGKGDWRQFMETTREQVQSGAVAPSKPPQNDKWNSVAGTEQIARADVPRASMEMNTSMEQPAKQYPSYGNAEDPPVLLRPDGTGEQAVVQSGVQPSLSQSVVQSAGNQSEPSGISSTSSASIGQSGGYSAQQKLIQSGAFSAQQAINQSGPFSAQQPAPVVPPPMMPPPAYTPPQMGIPQPPNMMPNPNTHPGMINHPGLPTMPGMIHPPQQPLMPPPYPGITHAGMPPAVPPGMPPRMVPGQPPDAAQFQNQYSTGGHGAMPAPPQYNGGQPQQQFNTGQQHAPQGQYSTGPHQAQMPPQQLPGNMPAGQYHSGPYGSVAGRPVHDPRAFQPPEPVSDDHAPYLLSESDFQEQSEQYEQADESGEYQPEAYEGVGEEWEGGGYEEETIETEEEESWEEPAVDTDATGFSFPQESFPELPVVSQETMQRFEAANKAGFVFSPQNDMVDAISVVLASIDNQIELLAKQGTEAFAARDFRRAESIIKLSERLTLYKTETQTILQLMSELEQ